MSPLAWVAFVTACAVGAPLRYVVDGAVHQRMPRDTPWGTFVVNLTGSLILGFIAGLAMYHAFPKTPKVVLGTGFCGSYTTFSTFAFEAVRLAEDGPTGRAGGYVLITLIGGALAAGLGLALAAL